MNWPESSSATSDGTRFNPSSPGMITGESTCMYATRELVVPKSMPSMRSSAALSPLFFLATANLFVFQAADAGSLCCLLTNDGIHIAHQISNVRTPVQQVYQLVTHAGPGLPVLRFGKRVPFVPELLQFSRQLAEFLLKAVSRLLQIAGHIGIVLAHLLIHAHLFQLHVEFEDFFQHVRRNHLLLFRPALPGSIRGVS